MIGQRKRRISEETDNSSTDLDTDSDYSNDEQPDTKRRRVDELFEELRTWREAREKFRLQFINLMRSYNEKVDKLAEMLLKHKTKYDLGDK